MRKTLFLAVLIGLFASCKQDIQIYVQYPDKEVALGVSRVITSVETPILAQARLSMSTTPVPSAFPEYNHDIPTLFDVYFIATTGADQGQVIKKFTGLTEGSHSVTIPAREYKVVITNYDIEGKSEYKRNWLPEASTEIYLYGSAVIDYATVDEGEVKVTNDYAAAMVLKNENVKSVPTINGTQFFNTDDYYVLYVRDQNGNSFTRTIQLKVLKKDNGVGDYSFNNNFDPNKVYRFLVNRWSNVDGNLTITVDEDILKDVVDREIVPNF